MILRAQMGKAGPPMRGKDLHTGDFAWGVLPAAAPLAVGSLTMAGMAMAFWRAERRPRRLLVHRRRRQLARRMARSDQPVRRPQAAGRSSACRTTRRRCPRRCTRTRPRASSPTRRSATACPASPSTAPTPTRSPRRSPGPPTGRAPAPGRRSSSSWRCACAGTPITTTCSTWARSRRRRGNTRRSTTAATPIATCTSSGRGGIRSRVMRRGWSARRSSTTANSMRLRTWADALVEAQAQRVHAEPWPEPHEAGIGVFKDEPPRTRIEVLDPARRQAGTAAPPLPALEPFAPFDAGRQHLARRGHARHRRRAARRPARVRLRRGRRRPLRQCVPAAAAAARRVRRPHPQLDRWPRARCSACASGRRWPVSARSARCSSTISSPPASTSS